MKAIKAAVIGMGILIVLGLGLLVYGVLTRIGNSGSAGSDVPAFATQLSLEEGQKVLSTSLDEGRLIVEIGDQSDGRLYLFFDSRTGRGLGQISVQTTKEP